MKEEGRGLNEKKASFEKQVTELAENEKLLVATESRQRGLDDPAARLRFLEKDVLREADIRVGLGGVESNLERLESERKLFDEQLDEFREFDEHWSSLTAERDLTAGAYRVFLTNEAEAASREERSRELNAADEAVKLKISASGAAERDFASAGVDYDAEFHRAEQASLLAAERLQAEIRVKFETAKRRAEQLATELQRFAEIRKSLQSEFKEKERLESVAEATAFIRDTLKEAAPRVARNYVHHVSLEANQMFREITGNAERTLKWAEDYSIILEEDGYERPFISLSGGEQMLAALAVRLALLKQLSDIRIAFFDEPTTNMDADRRENFAMQISRITHFDQLFVISHDDTFDSYVDNVLVI